MLNKNSENKGYQVWGHRASHHQNGVCNYCKQNAEIATLWFRTRSDDMDFNHSDICKDCAEKFGYEIVTEESIAKRANRTPVIRKFNYNLNRWK